MPHLRARAALVAAALLAVPLALPGPAGAEPPSAAIIVAFGALPAERHAYAGAAVQRVDEGLRFFVVHGDPRAIAVRAHGDPAVRYVEEDAEQYRALAAPNDPLYASYQYGLQAGTTGIEAAWDTTVGSTAVKACVVDTGQDRSHEDLAGIAWAGWRDYIKGKAAAYDDNGHGTHVTGILAAVRDNGKGIAGAAQASVAGAKVLSRSGSGTNSAVASGIAWCADQGAGIVSLSLGGGSSQAVADAVAYAAGKGALVIAAAGNSGPCTSCVSYPAALAAVVAVACTDAANALCSFSSRGPEVDLAAPGRSIASAWPAGISPCKRGAHDCYVLLSGTSMSTPLVSGLAALVWSAHPAFTAGDVRARLEATARDLGAAGWDPRFGHGLVQGAAVP